jgi:hypothetical protein
VFSENLDKKGEPVYEFILNTESGVAKKIKRDPSSSHEKIVLEEVDLHPGNPIDSKKQETTSFDASKYLSDWDDLDA